MLCFQVDFLNFCDCILTFQCLVLKNQNFFVGNEADDESDWDASVDDFSVEQKLQISIQDLNNLNSASSMYFKFLFWCQN